MQNIQPCEVLIKVSIAIYVFKVNNANINSVKVRKKKPILVDDKMPVSKKV